MNLCPCNSNLSYSSCCSLYINHITKPDSPEKLMRSRYTAYSLANIEYIKKTMKGNPLKNFDEFKKTVWAKSVTWLELIIINTFVETPKKGYVEFKAFFTENNELKYIHELSEFLYDYDAWYYINGVNMRM